MYLLWLRVAAVLYGLASLLAIPAVMGLRPRWRAYCLPLTIIGFIFHFVSSVEVLVAAHRWMPVGLHEIQSALALLIVAVFLMVWLAYRTISFGIFALPLAFLLTVIPAISPDKYTFSSPVVRSGWIAFHVAALLAAYAALIFSMLASFFYLLQERRLKNRQRQRYVEWLPSLEVMDQIAEKMLVLGFICMTAGLFAGSLIAQERIGASYFADPKVLLSFVMWALYILLLLVRRSTGLRGKRAAVLSSAVFLIMLSVLAANLVSSVHRYIAP